MRRYRVEFSEHGHAYREDMLVDSDDPYFSPESGYVAFGPDGHPTVWVNLMHIAVVVVTPETDADDPINDPDG